MEETDRHVARDRHLETDRHVARDRHVEIDERVDINAPTPFEKCSFFVFTYLKPIFIISLHCGTIVALGDICAQFIVEAQGFSGYRFYRTFEFFVVGLLIIGPVCAIWVLLLAHWFGIHGKAMAIKKTVVDQIFFAPFGSLLFLVSIHIVQGKTWKETENHVKTKYVTLLINNWKVWPLVQIFNFYWVPVKYQVAVVQTIGLFWNTYVSYYTTARS